jgi:large conductance mechanosensitive channel
MAMMDEFKAFALKGNVVDLAVGVIIGGAFGKIVDSAVQDLIMPIVGKIFGGFDFSSLFIVLGDNPNKLTALADLKKAGVATFAYGNFITILINFIILAWIIFMMIKAMNKVRSASEPPAPPTPEDVVLLREIRDSLKK